MTYKALLYSQFIRKIIILVAVFSISVYAKPESQSLQPPLKLERDTIVIARVSTNPKKHFKHLKPIVNYLADNLKDLGIKEGKILFAEDNQQMLRYIKQGKVDVITETVFSAVLFYEEAGAEVILRRWKKGVPEYSTVIFTRKDSGIESLDDLQGQVIAFQDRGSSSAYFIPASLLIRDGYELYELDSPRESPPKDKIGFVFADKEINISAWVHKGIVSAGAFSDIDWNNEEDMPREFRKELAIVYQSTAFPRALELVRHDMHPVVKERIRDILLTAHENDYGRNALHAYQKTKKYDDINESSLDAINLASELLNIVENKL